jgi:uncharacterized protein DUF4359
MSLFRLSLLSTTLLIAVGLALSNPTTEDYLAFVEQELGKALDRMDQNTPSREQIYIRQVFKRQSKTLLESIVRPHTVRHSIGLFSRYDTEVLNSQVVVIGIAGRFIPIKGVEEVTIKIGRMVF